MPRRTPVRELQKEEAVPSSPLRRSSRISNNSPVPTKVVSRRNSATEASVSTPKATRGRRSSLSQDQESEANEIEVDKKAVKTPRTRRASLTTTEEEEEEVPTTKSKTARSNTPDPKKPVTRRRRSTSQDPEVSEEEPVKKTRSRTTSASKSNETVEVGKPKKKPSENGHVEVDEEIDQPNVSKKRKIDTLKVDLDLSVIKEGSFIEDEDTASADKEVEEIQNVRDKTVQESVFTDATEDNARKEVTVENGQVEEKTPEITIKEKSTTLSKTAEISKDMDDTTKEKPVVESGQAKEVSKPEDTSSVKAIQTEDSKDVEDATNEKLAEKKSDSTIMKEKCAPIIEETESVKEDKKIEEQKSESTPSIQEKTPPTKEISEHDQIEEEKSVLKENSSVKDISGTSFSDSSFHLEISSSALDDVNKTDVDGNLSPTSNKENVRPQQKSEEPQPEPMDVDDSYSEIPSPSKITRKSLNVKLDDVEKKLEIAEKVTDEIGQFLTEESTQNSLQNKKIVIPKIVYTLSETTGDSGKEITVDVTSPVQNEKSNKEDNEIISKSVKEPDTQEIGKNIKVKSAEKEPSKEEKISEPLEEDKPVQVTETTSDSLSNSNISLAIDEESINLSKTEEILSSEDPKPSEEEASQKSALQKQTENVEGALEREDSIKDEAMENSQVSLKDVSISSNQFDIMADSTTESLQEKAMGQSILEKFSVEIEDSKGENQKEVEKSSQVSESVNPEESANEREVSPSKAVALENVRKEEVESSPESAETPSCSLKASVTIATDEKGEDSKAADVAESQESDVEKKEDESEEEIVVDDEGDIVGCGEREDSVNLGEAEASVDLEANKEIFVSSLVFNKPEDNKEPGFAIKTVHEETFDEPLHAKLDNDLAERVELEIRRDIYESVRSSREIVILSDDENSPEENEVAVASEGEDEVEFVREDLDPTVVKVSPRGSNELNVHETISCEKVNSINSSKSWVDKTTFVMQETIRADEDKERSLRDRIHKVVDLFCSEIKDKGDISINVSLECTGQASDVSDHETSIKQDAIDVASGPADEEQIAQGFANKGSKRRKLYDPQNYDFLPMFSENTTEENNQSEDKTSQKKKKRKLRKKASQQVQLNEESIKQKSAEETSPKKKSKKLKSTSSSESRNEEEISSKEKTKKQKSAVVIESHEEVSPTKKAKKHKNDTDKNEKIENKQEKNKKQVSKTKNQDQKMLEESMEIVPNKNENATAAASTEEEAYSSPFSLYFSSSFNMDDSEDENDDTYQPSRDLDSSDCDTVTDESFDTDHNNSEEETEKSYLYIMKTDKKSKQENQRLSNSSDDDEDAPVSSGSEDVFADDEPTRVKHKKQKDKSKQKIHKNEQTVGDEDKSESPLKKGKRLKQSEDVPEVPPNSGKKQKRKHPTYTVSDKEFVPERRIKKEKISPFKSAAKATAEKLNCPAKTTKVPIVKTKVGKNVGKKPNKKVFKLKPSTAAASGWEVEIV